MSTDDRSLVFVYGTLKIGQPNHHVLKERGSGQARLVGLAKTVDKFPLVIGNRFNIPYILDAKGKGKIVTGDLFEVDNAMLDRLDKLESHPDYYTRETTEVTTLSDGKSHCAWIYVLRDFLPELLKKDMLENYDTLGEHGLRYVARSERTREALDNPWLAWSDVKVSVPQNIHTRPN